MSRLCFSSYAKEVQKALQVPNGNEHVANALFSFIIKAADLMGQNEEQVYLTPKLVSLLFGNKQDVPENIVGASVRPKVIEAAYPHFKNTVLTNLNPHTMTDLVPGLRAIIKSDGTISAEKKRELLDKATPEALHEFLADTFLYAINRPNKFPTDASGEEISSELTPVIDEIARAQEIFSKYPRPSELNVPTEPVSDEITYVRALLAAYADAENCPTIEKEDLPAYPKYKRNFDRQRKDYYAAETIRRGTRDIFGDRGSDEFEELKDETYSGIVDEHSKDFPDGYARLNSVMSQAAGLPIQKCLLSRLPDWIGPGEKKGVCHILVNDEKIKGWVTDE